MRIQAYLTAAVMNLKRLAKALGPLQSPKSRLWRAFEAIWSGFLEIFRLIGTFSTIRRASNLLPHRNLHVAGT